MKKLFVIIIMLAGRAAFGLTPATNLNLQVYRLLFNDGTEQFSAAAGVSNYLALAGGGVLATNRLPGVPSSVMWDGTNYVHGIAPGAGNVSLTNAWRMIYSDADTNTVELALGANGLFLRSSSPTSAPTWIAPPSGFPLTSSVSAAGFNITGAGTIQAALFQGGNFAGQDMTLSGNLHVTSNMYVNTTVYINTGQVVTVYNSTNFVETTVFTTQAVYQFTYVYTNTILYATNYVVYDHYVNIGGSFNASNAALAAFPGLQLQSGAGATATGIWDFSSASVTGLLSAETDPIFVEWLSTAVIATVESDPVFTNWAVTTFSNDVISLVEATGVSNATVLSYNGTNQITGPVALSLDSFSLTDGTLSTVFVADTNKLSLTGGTMIGPLVIGPAEQNTITFTNANPPSAVVVGSANVIDVGTLEAGASNLAFMAVGNRNKIYGRELLGASSAPTPNTVAGYLNVISNNHGGCMIGGGMLNRIHSSAGGQNAILHGYLCTISGNHLGGTCNVIGGGHSCSIAGGTSYGVIGGGNDNNLISGAFVTISGGTGNSINENSTQGSSCISGGNGNKAGTVGVGYRNSIGGGAANVLSNTIGCVIGGGYANIQGYGARYSTIPGGDGNYVFADRSFAAGWLSKVNIGHPNSFVWSDTASGFMTTAPSQVLFSATGGFGINTNSPLSALHVNGSVRADSFLDQDGSPFSMSNNYYITSIGSLTITGDVFNATAHQPNELLSGNSNVVALTSNTLFFIDCNTAPTATTYITMSSAICSTNLSASLVIEIRGTNQLTINTESGSITGWPERVSLQQDKTIGVMFYKPYKDDVWEANQL